MDDKKNVIFLGNEDIELCREAAILHIKSIHHGLLPLLGVGFLTKLYLSIAVAPQSCVLAIVKDDVFLGFIAGCANVRKTYCWIILNYGFGLAVAAGLALFQPTVFGRLLSVLYYPFHRDKVTKKIDIINAELLAIAVNEYSYGKGYGRELINKFEEMLRQWGVQKYQVLTNITEVVSNAFYRSTGFLPVRVIGHHVLRLQVYEKSLCERVNKRLNV